MNIYGVIGWPIKHSLSPAMHNAAFKELGIEAEYKLFEVRPEELEDFILNRKDVIGFNVTIPHKVRAKEIIVSSRKFIERHTDIQYLQFCGAINTVKRDDEMLSFTNTDVSGFMESLKRDLNFSHANKNVLLIGCGGAGRAIIAGLALTENSCDKIYVFDTNAETLRLAKAYFEGFTSLEGKIEFIPSEQQISNRIKNCQLLVNATPIGMKKGDPSPIDKKLLHKDLFVYDVVYNRETELIKDTKSLNLSCSGGLGMFLYQGAKSFEFWTGQKAPIKIMRNALEKTLIDKTSMT